MVRALISFLLLLSSCASTPNSWVLHSISTGDTAFNSSRLRYCSPAAHPQLGFEILKIGDEITAFIHLNRFRFSEKNQVKISVTIGKTIYEELTLVHEGSMRVRVGAEMTKKMIQALQEGVEVVILVDGFEETLTPSQIFSDFLGEGTILK